jgi:hypothetical protein
MTSSLVGSDSRRPLKKMARRDLLPGSLREVPRLRAILVTGRETEPELDVDLTRKGAIMTRPTRRTDLWWWYWVATFVLIAAALFGWTLGYGLVIVVGALQLGHSFIRNGSIASLPVQIRLVYFAVTLFGLWEGPRFYVYALLLVGTFMVAFLGRCGIALVLKRMPWNRGRELRLD